jgi:transposase
MAQSTTIVAFDQHAQSVVAAVWPRGTREPVLHPLPNDLGIVGRFVKRLQRQGPVQCCYEAGPCGFALQRMLTGEGIPCDVIAPSLIPRRVGDRIKTDRRDARQLAVLYRAGALTVIRVPHEAEEAIRDLLRCREDAQADVVRSRQRLAKFLLRHDRRFTGAKRAWGARHRDWLRGLRWTLPALTQTCTAYLRAVDEAEARVAALEADLVAYVDAPPLADAVRRLRCFKGVADLTALTLAAELGDLRRFARAPQLMAFVGLVPSEHSSGSRRGRGAITKTGNGHVRRVLVEAAWHYRHTPHVGRGLAARQRHAPPGLIQQAWAAQYRLHRTYRRLVARGRPHNVAVTAVARELTGFVWAALTHDPIGASSQRRIPEPTMR